MVSRGAPDLDSLQVWDSEGLWESTAREINIGKHQRQAPPPSTAHHRVGVHLRRHPPPTDAPDRAIASFCTALRMLAKRFNDNANSRKTIVSDLSHTKVRKTAPTTTAPRAPTPKAAAPTKAAPHMTYSIGVTGERATQPANNVMHAPTAAAELYFNTNEMALFLEGLRERAAMNEAEMDEMQARIDFQDDLQGPAPPHARRRLRPPPPASTSTALSPLSCRPSLLLPVQLPGPTTQHLPVLRPRILRPLHLRLRWRRVQLRRRLVRRGVLGRHHRQQPLLRLMRLRRARVRRRPDGRRGRGV